MRRRALAYNPVSGLDLPFENIIHQYDFDGDSTDAVGALDGTDTNMTYGTGLGDNKSAVFDTTGYIDLPDGLLGGNVDYAISFLIKMDSTTNKSRIALDGSTDGYSNISFNESAANKIATSARYSGTTYSTTAQSWTATNWNHIVVDVIGNTSVTLSLNGSFLASVAVTGVRSTLGTGNNVLGATRNHALLMDGELAALKFWSDTLTTDEKTTLSTAELAGIKVN